MGQTSAFFDNIILSKFSLFRPEGDRVGYPFYLCVCVYLFNCLFLNSNYFDSAYKLLSPVSYLTVSVVGHQNKALYYQGLLLIEL